MNVPGCIGRYVTVPSITPTRSPVIYELELLPLIVVGDKNNRMTADKARAFLRKGDDPGLSGRHTLLVHLNPRHHGAVLRQRALDHIQTLEGSCLGDQPPRGLTNGGRRFGRELPCLVRPYAFLDRSLPLPVHQLHPRLQLRYRTLSCPQPVLRRNRCNAR
jgi:hypothetical protein